MRDGWRAVSLGEAMRLDIDRVAVDRTQFYPLAGVYSFGRGLFAREALAGTKTSYTYLHRLHPGQLVMSKLKAWEGAFAVVPETYGNWLLSPEFPTYTMNEEVVLPGFLFLLVANPPFWRLAMAKSKGMGGRKERVNPKALLDIELSLPPLADQRRIVDLIEHIAETYDKAAALAESARELGNAIRNDWFGKRMALSRPLRSVVEVTNGRLRNPRNAIGPYMTRYVRTANVQDSRLEMDQPMFMNFTPQEQARYALRAGDVLVTEGSGSRASIGASCQWNGEIPGVVCFQNHLLRLRPLPQAGLPSAFVYDWALWSHRTGRFAEIATGTNILSLGVERVSAMPVPIAEPSDADAFVSTMEAVREEERAANALVAAASRLRSGIITALLSGDHDIPSFYDRFLDGAA
jgi:type I restriction enzyme, S subunit